MNKLAGVLFGIPVGIMLFVFAVYLFARSGFAPVTTTATALPMEHFLAKTALHAKMDSEYPREVPVKPDRQTFLAGASVYRENCAVCHGVPGGVQNSIAAGMFPRPPQLFEAKDMVTDDPPGETFWKEKYGIRLSGMPGFSGELSDEQMWQVGVLLSSADKLDPLVKQAIAASTK